MLGAELKCLSINIEVKFARLSEFGSILFLLILIKIFKMVCENFGIFLKFWATNFLVQSSDCCGNLDGCLQRSACHQLNFGLILVAC